MKTRIVEVYVGVCCPNEWYVVDTEVPFEYGAFAAKAQAVINVRNRFTDHDREIVEFVTAGKIFSDEEMEALQ